MEYIPSFEQFITEKRNIREEYFENLIKKNEYMISKYNLNRRIFTDSEIKLLDFQTYGLRYDKGTEAPRKIHRELVNKGFELIDYDYDDDINKHYELYEYPNRDTDKEASKPVDYFKNK